VTRDRTSRTHHPGDKNSGIVPINFTVGTGWVLPMAIDMAATQQFGIVGISGVIRICPPE